ncbi:TPA: hypothetical protein MBF38_004793 [Klebsiella aerogenes]|nr:hypothetical protein [Klebsiella aerogenes]
MKKLTIAMVIIAVIIVLVTYLLFNPALNEGTQDNCQTEYDKQAIDIVKQDYLENRLPRWSEEVSKLGTPTPTLSFGNVRIDAGAYSVDFKITGPKSTIDRIGIVDCKNHSVEYSIIY